MKRMTQFIIISLFTAVFLSNSAGTLQADTFKNLQRLFDNKYQELKQARDKINQTKKKYQRIIKKLDRLKKLYNDIKKKRLLKEYKKNINSLIRNKKNTKLELETTKRDYIKVFIAFKNVYIRYVNVINNELGQYTEKNIQYLYKKAEKAKEDFDEKKHSYDRALLIHRNLCTRESRINVIDARRRMKKSRKKYINFLTLLKKVKKN